MSIKRSRSEREMEGVIHQTVEVNGIKMHVAEKGQGPAVLLLHGFPELWYSWRHQIMGLADKGYRAIAPDLRGYGETEAPEPISSYTLFHLIGDLIALLDVLSLEQVYVVGHDWGAIIAWYLCMFRPDRVKALVNLSVPFLPPNKSGNFTNLFRSLYGDDFYICRFQEPGDVEQEFVNVDLVMRRFFALRDTGPLMIPKGWGSSTEQVELPSWISEEELQYYVREYKRTGFTGPVNYYRNLDKDWELMTLWVGSKIVVPTKYIVGDSDLVYYFFPGIQDYIHKGGLKNSVPLLEDVVVMPGVAHWINQEKPQEITDYILEFIKKF